MDDARLIGRRISHSLLPNVLVFINFMDETITRYEKTELHALFQELTRIVLSMMSLLGNEEPRT